MIWESILLNGGLAGLGRPRWSGVILDLGWGRLQACEVGVVRCEALQSELAARRLSLQVCDARLVRLSRLT